MFPLNLRFDVCGDGSVFVRKKPCFDGESLSCLIEGHGHDAELSLVGFC